MVTDHFPLELGTKEIKEREDGERGGGDFSREKIIFTGPPLIPVL